MKQQELFEKIISKKEFSKLPKKDVKIALEKFDKEENTDYGKLKLTRNLLRKVFSSFSSRKLLNSKMNKEINWYLMKHKSTKERFPYYEEIYKRIFSGIKKCSVVDLGAGINGLNFRVFRKIDLDVDYVAVEAVGQLVDLMNIFFKKNKLKGKAYHFSLFEIEKVKNLIKKQKKPRIVFLMKTIDSLEILKRDYSKELIENIISLSDKIVLSFATRSIGSRRKFSANRNWIVKFIKENYKIEEDFELGGERYLVFCK